MGNTTTGIILIDPSNAAAGLLGLRCEKWTFSDSKPGEAFAAFQVTPIAMEGRDDASLEQGWSLSDTAC
jgi:hypothetical protein